MSAARQAGGRLAARCRAFTLGVCCQLFIPAFAAGQGGEPSLQDEYRAKGAMLQNLAKYVEWPVESFSGIDGAFIIAVVDRGEAAPVIEQVFAGTKIGGHPVEVRPVAANRLPKDAHIVLVTRAAGVSPEVIRDGLGQSPLLLVGETDQFAERGGAFAFVRDGAAFRLTLCPEHAAESGLKLSARLATVVRSVRPSRRN